MKATVEVPVIHQDIVENQWILDQAATLVSIWRLIVDPQRSAAGTELKRRPAPLVNAEFSARSGVRHVVLGRKSR